MKELIITIICGILFLICFYGLFNGIVAISCLSLEGNVTWNKVVVACHFDNHYDITSQSITTIQSYQNCSINGKPVSCDDIQDWVLEQGIRDI